MDIPDEEDRPPISTDVEGWRQCVRNGTLRNYRLEEIVAAIQDLGPHADKEVLHGLCKHLSDALMHLLRGRVSRSHRNNGEDIIYAAYTKIVDALLKPQSADGQGLRKAFVARVDFRLKDAIDEEQRANRHPVERIKKKAESKASSGGAHTRLDGLAVASEQPDQSCELAQDIDVKEILERVPDERKRLAFRLYMDDMPFKSKKFPSISKALGISEKTAREWVKDVQVLLSSDSKVKELLQPTTRG